MFWIVIGVLVLLVASGYALFGAAMDLYFVDQWPELAAAVGPLLRGQAGAQQWASLAFGIFALFFGTCLLSLRSWARTVGVAFNIAMSACLAVLVLMLYFRLTAPGFVAVAVPAALPRWLGIGGGTLALLLLVAGFHLSTPAAMDAFSGAPPTVPPPPLVKCPTCGGPLDLNKTCCPVCDNPPPPEQGLVKAYLEDAQTGRRYSVSTLRETRIGRDSPGIEVQCEDRSVSREHALIEYEGGRFYLHALRDLNGTYLDGARVRDCELTDGCTITFGKAQFHFVVEKRE